MTKAISILETSCEVPRVYIDDRNNHNSILPFIELFEHQYPDQDWRHCCEIISNASSEPQQMALKNLVKWGSAGASVSLMEERWNIQLPEWIHSFYDKVTEAVLLMRNVVHILSPGGIIKHEEWVREVTNQPILPFRLIRFALILAEGDEFAFRQRVDTNEWEIVYAWSGETTVFLQSSEGDRHEHDENIDEWLIRLIETDGYPLIKGNEDAEFMDVVRIR